MWVKCGQLTKAGEEALKAKNQSLLEELKGKASGSAVHDIESMIRQLKSGRR
jgi:vacuolar protein sorting-associated protein 16